MKKVALVFVLAVFVPSLALAWLAVRSLRDQQIVLERQRSLLYQGVADSVAKEAANLLAEHQREFARQVEAILGDNKATEAADSFDKRLRKEWRLADVGFAVSLDGQVYSPNVFDGTEACAASDGQPALFQSRSGGGGIPPAHRRLDRRHCRPLSAKQIEPDVLVSLAARPAPGVRRTHQPATPGRNFAKCRESRFGIARQRYLRRVAGRQRPPGGANDGQ